MFFFYSLEQLVNYSSQKLVCGNIIQEKNLCQTNQIGDKHLYISKCGVLVKFRKVFVRFIRFIYSKNTLKFSIRTNVSKHPAILWKLWLLDMVGALLLFLERYLNQSCCISCNIFVLREIYYKNIEMKHQWLKIYKSMCRLLTSFVVTQNRA